jgi:hypothetical protein
MKHKLLIGALAALAVAGLAGCTAEARQDYDAAGENIERGMEKTGEAVTTDAQATGENIREGAEVAGEAVEGAVENAGEAVENAGEAAQNAGKEIGEKADNAQTTLAVKNAILSADDLDATDLNVDTEESTVYLRGHVPTAQAKRRAEALAKNVVGTKYTVRNELTVRPNR